MLFSLRTVVVWCIYCVKNATHTGGKLHKLHAYLVYNCMKINTKAKIILFVCARE